MGSNCSLWTIAGQPRRKHKPQPLHSSASTLSGRQVLRCTPDPGWVPTTLGAAQRLARQCLQLDLSEEPVGAEELLHAAGRLGLQAGDVPGLKELFGIASHLTEMEGESRMREP